MVEVLGGSCELPVMFFDVRAKEENSHSELLQ